jgi:Mrp family chromosome partitioning ATPase
MSRNFQLLERLDRELRHSGEAECRTEEDLAASATFKPSRRTRTYEELKKLVQRLFLCGPAPTRLVVFAGAGPGVGCTWICVNATKVLSSQTTRRVCLVDTNTTSPSVAEYFHIPNSGGFVEALAGVGPVRSFTRRVANNVWVLTAGKHTKAEIVLSPERLEAGLFELGREFDLVLFDAPPVAANSGSLALASLVDGAVLVLKAGHTPRRAVRLAVKEFESAHVKLLGTVLNQRDYPIPEAIYRKL